jgi:hypothetical protein
VSSPRYINGGKFFQDEVQSERRGALPVQCLSTWALLVRWWRWSLVAVVDRWLGVFVIQMLVRFIYLRFEECLLVTCNRDSEEYPPSQPHIIDVFALRAQDVSPPHPLNCVDNCTGWPCGRLPSVAEHCVPACRDNNFHAQFKSVIAAQ